MTELDVLDLVASARGSEKIEILKQHVDNRQLLELLDAVFSYRRRFYIKTFEMPSSSGSGSTHQDFIKLLSDLESQGSRSSNTVAMVQSFLAKCSVQQAKWYRKILLRDLDAGIGVSSAVKAGFMIPVFDVMLAKDAAKSKGVDKLLKQGCYASRKYDGYRCIAIVVDGEVELLSRNGEPYKNFPMIEASLKKVCGEGSYILDGEIMSNDFNAIQQSAFASTRGTVVGDVSYWVFDLIPFSEWTTDNFIKKAGTRYSDLESFFADKVAANPEVDNIKLVEHTRVTSIDDVKELERQFMGEGYEGLMLNPDIPYYRGRYANRMLKFKTMQSMDCRVVSAYEGEGRNLGRLGGLTIIQENGVSCDCGSGFSDQDREYIWANSDQTVGRIAEIKYQELTPDGRMRFPIFIRWRDAGAGKGKI